jgi:hypothetical protein
VVVTAVRVRADVTFDVADFFQTAQAARHTLADASSRWGGPLNELSNSAFTMPRFGRSNTLRQESLMRGRHADRGLAVAAMMARQAPRMLAILLFVLAAQSVHALWQGGRTPQVVPTESLPPIRPAPLVADVGAIVGRHLFGNAAASRADAPPPPTRAALVLGGVWYTPAGDAYALIGEPGAPQRPYRTGDRLPGGVELAGVEAAHVLLRRDGKVETLALPRAATVAQPAAATRRLP